MTVSNHVQWIFQNVLWCYLIRFSACWLLLHCCSYRRAWCCRVWPGSSLLYICGLRFWVEDWNRSGSWWSVLRRRFYHSGTKSSSETSLRPLNTTHHCLISCVYIAYIRLACFSDKSPSSFYSDSNHNTENVL